MATTARSAPHARTHVQPDVRPARGLAPLIALVLVLTALAVLALLATPAIGLAAV